MIDAGPSLKAAERISATDLAKYLRAQGWKVAPSQVKGISIFSMRIPGSDEAAELILPERVGFSDELRRVADALRTVAQIADQPEIVIAERILSAQAGATEQNKREGAKLST